MNKLIYYFVHITIDTMSTDEYNRKLDSSKKLINSIRKDLKHREGQEQRGETTYSIDAEIRGSFGELVPCIPLFRLRWWRNCSKFSATFGQTLKNSDFPTKKSRKEGSNSIKSPLSAAVCRNNTIHISKKNQGRTYWETMPPRTATNQT